ncbi:unnamed protein product [Chironomus riparius]|uniref:Uncharacterized protein n=1 Tax=Chironomus riparius TaxID=315576 RepID=A0A9N9RXA5_9DIPT|nr:unnamed protein product [Chironomus riparius]
MLFRARTEMNKLILATFVILACSLQAAHCGVWNDFVSETVYEVIHNFLKEKYADSPDTTDCLMKHFKVIDLSRKVDRPEILVDNDLLNDFLKPYIDDALSKCRIEDILKLDIDDKLIPMLPGQALKEFCDIPPEEFEKSSLARKILFAINCKEKVLVYFDE